MLSRQAEFCRELYTHLASACLRLGKLREQFESIDMRWTNNGEVAMIQCCQLGHFKSLSRCDDRSIDRTEGKIPIGGRELRNSKPVRCSGRLCNLGETHCKARVGTKSPRVLEQ